MLSVAFSPVGHLLAAADDETVALWDITSLAHPHLVSTLSGAVANVTDLAYSPAGTMIAGEESDGDACRGTWIRTPACCCPARSRLRAGWRSAATGPS